MNPEVERIAEAQTRFTVEPQPGRWDPGTGRIVIELEDAAYKRGWNDAVDRLVALLEAAQAGIKAGADPLTMLQLLGDMNREVPK